ncbi:MAG TPA: hypothetical protein VN708_18660 [Terriglobales bacterium]|jgi:hypothetical protein|nr:hypothetical protein [Terriglobales bacterium]
MKKLFCMATLGLAMLVGSSFANAQDWRYDHDDYRYGRGYGYDNRRGLHVAREIGYRDGLQVAREDNWHGKPYNPYPRGKYAWADRGYRHEFGDRNAYRERYADAYRDGYMAAFRGNRGFEGYFGWGR